MERGLIMLLHSTIIGIILYIIMIFIGQSQTLAENRSIMIAAFVLVYMIMFGHALPTFTAFA